MRYFNIIIFLVFISAVASAQVDTLQLVEIGSIQAPSEITELYVEDLDGDSLKEIILCTDSYVYIYNSQTYQVEWTSPPLNHPADLLFEDINNDGLTDLSVHDSSNIYLFDPHTPQTIWISPELDSTYKCYTIGDKDDDVWKDFGYAFLVGSDWTSIYDTAHVVIYDGPGFASYEELVIPMIHYDSLFFPVYWGEQEIPQKIRFYNLVSQGQNYFYIALITIYSSYYYDATTGGSGSNGEIYLVDPLDLNYTKFETNGVIINDHFCVGGDSSYIFLMDYGAASGPNFARSASYIHHLSADTIISYLLWNRDVWEEPFVPPQFSGYAINDIDYNHDGIEIVYAVASLYFNYNEVVIYLKSIDDLELLWSFELEPNCSGHILSKIEQYNIDFCPCIVVWDSYCYDGYIFIEGAAGEIRGYLSDDNVISKIADIDFDGNDEVFSIQSNSLFIYYLDYATGIGDETNLPNRAFLRSNYPNPFNSSTTIEYGLPEAGRVRIDIYDLLGRKVETLVDEDVPAGRHKVVWEASVYSSGVYFYRIEAGDFADTKRMVYLK